MKKTLILSLVLVPIVVSLGGCAGVPERRVMEPFSDSFSYDLQVIQQDQGQLPRSILLSRLRSEAAAITSGRFEVQDADGERLIRTQTTTDMNNFSLQGMGQQLPGFDKQVVNSVSFSIDFAIDVPVDQPVSSSACIKFSRAGGNINNMVRHAAIRKTGFDTGWYVLQSLDIRDDRLCVEYLVWDQPLRVPKSEADKDQ